jgi:hypothetical protein
LGSSLRVIKREQKRNGSIFDGFQPQKSFFQPEKRFQSKCLIDNSSNTIQNEAKQTKDDKTRTRFINAIKGDQKIRFRKALIENGRISIRFELEKNFFFILI